MAGYRDQYLRRESPRAGTYYWLASGCETEPSEENSDMAYLQAGHVTYTFVGNLCNSADPAFAAKLADVKIDV